MQVSKDEDNKYNAIYKDHNTTRVQEHLQCFCLQRKKGLLMNSQEITKKLNKWKMKENKELQWKIAQEQSLNKIKLW